MTCSDICAAITSNSANATGILDIIHADQGVALSPRGELTLPRGQGNKQKINDVAARCSFCSSPDLRALTASPLAAIRLYDIPLV